MSATVESEQVRLEVRGIMKRGELIKKQSYEDLSMRENWIQLMEPSQRTEFEETTTKVTSSLGKCLDSVRKETDLI